MVGRGDHMNVARTERIAVAGMRRTELGVAGEQGWQDARVLADVQDHEDGRRQIGRKGGGDLAQRRDAAA